MEKPNNGWFAPPIATLTVDLTGATLREQQLARQTAEKNAIARQALLEEKKVKR